MCRSIKPLFNYDPPATEADVQAAALQYVRKLSGFVKPSQANQAAFEAAVAEIAAASALLLAQLESHTPPKNRAAEVVKARERFARQQARRS